MRSIRGTKRAYLTVQYCISGGSTRETTMVCSLRTTVYRIVVYGRQENRLYHVPTKARRVRGAVRHLDEEDECPLDMTVDIFCPLACYILAWTSARRHRSNGPRRTLTTTIQVAPWRNSEVRAAQLCHNPSFTWHCTSYRSAP